MTKHFFLTLAFLLGFGQMLMAQLPGCSAFFVTQQNPGNMQVEFFNFTYNVDPQAATFTWDFGDGTYLVTDDLVLSHTYAQNGTYAVCLSVFDTVQNCVNAYCQGLELNPIQCGTYFIHSVAAGNEVTFFGQSDFPDSLSTYTWDFGDGSTATGSSPVHAYAQPGTYNVCLTLDAPGCNTQFCQHISSEYPQGCHSSYWAWPDGPQSQTLQFFNTTFGTPNANYTWNFGDGTVITNNDPSFVHTFAAPGNYYVCLDVQDGLCTSQFCQNWQVGDPAFICDASFAYQANGLDFTVFEQSQVQDSIITYDWTFGDGGTDTGAQATHTYAQDGVYEVCLTTTTTFCSETECLYIWLSNPGNCHPSFWAYSDTLFSLNMYFSNWTLGSPLATYSWDFGDGTVSNNAQPNFVHTYAAPGLYYVCLNVQDGNCSEQICQEFQVGNPAFICSAYYSAHPNGLSVDFVEYTQVVDSVVTFDWDFGDGSTGTGSLPTHVYAAPGVYDVCLTVSTTFCSTQYCAPIHVSGLFNGGNCQASYWAWPDGANPLSIVFSNISTAGPNAVYEWDFGDGMIIANNSPSLVYTYAAPGSYNICLTVTDGNCTNTYCSPLHVQNGGGQLPTCTAGFVPFELGTDVYLVSDLQDPAFLYEWEVLPSGDLLSGPNAIFTPPAPGVYWVCLTVTAPDGSCQDYFCQSVAVQNVQPTCQAGVLVVPDPNAMQNFTYTFTNTSIGGDPNTVYVLTVDTQNIFFNGPSVTYTFPAAGIYSVCISMQGDSCTDTQCFPLQVGAQAFNCQASFYFDLDSIVFDPYNLVAVHNSIFDPGAQFFWEFGDGHVSTDAYPTHTYADFGVYTICLTLSNPLTGCYDYMCDTIGVDSFGNIWRDGPSGFTINIQQGSPTSVEEVQPSLSPSLRLFPNPATTLLNLDLTLPVQEECVLTVTSVTGQILLQRQVQLNAGEQQLSVPVGDLPAGVYAIQLQGQKVSLSELFVKQ